MKINTYQNQGITEDRVDIYYKEINIEIEGILTYLNENQRKIIGFNNDEKYVLNIKDIYYFDTVDKKSFAYLKEAVYQVQYSLYELEASCSSFGFVRINKSMIVNIYKVSCIKSSINMKLKIQLDNNEMLIISRHYKKVFENKLEEIKNELIGGNK